MKSLVRQLLDTCSKEEIREVMITKGMANAFGGSKKCSHCGFKIPTYSGRYPGHCPNCDEKLVRIPRDQE